MLKELLDKEGTLKAELSALQSKGFEKLSEDEQKRFAAGRDELVAIKTQIKTVAAQGFSTANKGMDLGDKMDIREQFNKYLTTGQTFGSTGAVTTATQTGVLLPKEVLNSTELRRYGNAVKQAFAYYGMKWTELGSNISYNKPVTSFGDGAKIAEDYDTKADATGDYSKSIAIAPEVFHSKPVWYSNAVLSTPGYDAVASILPGLRVAVDRAEMAAWATPLIAATAGVTTASGTSVTFAEFQEFKHSLGAYSYSGPVAILALPALIADLDAMADDYKMPINKLRRDQNGIYVWDGIPVLPCDSMEAMTAENTIAVIMNLDGVELATVTPAAVKRYEESAYPDQMGFDLIEYADFGFVADAVLALKTGTGS